MWRNGANGALFLSRMQTVLLNDDALNKVFSHDRMRSRCVPPYLVAGGGRIADGCPGQRVSPCSECRSRLCWISPLHTTFYEVSSPLCRSLSPYRTTNSIERT